MFQGQVTDEQKSMMGLALLDGAIGGKACYNSTDDRGDGGFGGGGGGCTMGGGGGGYAGILIKVVVVVIHLINNTVISMNILLSNYHMFGPSIVTFFLVKGQFSLYLFVIFYSHKL